MKLKFFLLLIFIVNFIYPQNGETIIKKLQEKFETIEDFSAEVIPNSPKSQKEKFFYKKGNKFKVTFSGQTLVSDGSTIWNYSPRTKRVILSSLGDEENYFLIGSFVYDYPNNSKITYLGKEKDAEIVKLESSKDESFKSIKLWINKEYLIDKIEFENLSGIKFGLKFSDIKLNQKLNNSIFTFSPPSGTEVIDLR